MVQRMVAMALLIFCLGAEISSTSATPTPGDASHEGECPAIKLVCDASGPSGETWFCTIHVEGAGAKVEPTYRWWVSQGRIKSGQGTASISLGRPDLSREDGFRAGVELGGMPEGCPRRPSILMVSGRRGRA
jgi:hypothetical protein